jgi:hypothetical protein
VEPTAALHEEAGRLRGGHVRSTIGISAIQRPVFHKAVIVISSVVRKRDGERGILMNRRLGIAAAGLLWVITAGGTALAFPIAPPGTECLRLFVAGTDPIVATYQGNSASFSNDLFLALDSSGQPGDDGNSANDLFLFNNHASTVGSTVTLGPFPIGTELIFRLHVNNTGNNFYTGPASRNPDGHCHARAQASWMPSETLVSFEDLFNGPFDYNDLSFSFTNTTTSVITLSPSSATNPVGTEHTVTATIQNNAGVPQRGFAVAFSIVSGPNTAASGTCAANADCTTDANGQVSFTYISNGSTGTDEIRACFTDTQGQHCSLTVTKEWTGCGPDGTPCNDGSACTTNDTCQGGTCVGGPPPDCDDNNVCTTDTCNPATGCVFTNNTVACDDGNACTMNDTCANGACVGGPAPNCNDSNPCTDDSCNPATGCVHTNNTAPCDDGNACTTTDACKAGACVGSNLVVCRPLDQCHDVGICNPANGQCSNPVKHDGTTCDDRIACTTDTCVSGVCVSRDLTPPAVTCAVNRASLWPPSHDLVDVGLTGAATDLCDGSRPVAVAMFGDEDDETPTGDGNFSPDAKNIAPTTLRLRSERKGDAAGRVYLIVSHASDSAGNIGASCCTVVVPHSTDAAEIAAVNAQAVAAMAYCAASNGAPPPGYVVVGDGPVIGPKQ